MHGNPQDLAVSMAQCLPFCAASSGHRNGKVRKKLSRTVHVLNLSLATPHALATPGALAQNVGWVQKEGVHPEQTGWVVAEQTVRAEQAG
jgi:hypothetical protein